MKKISKISQFVEYVFDLYNMDKLGFFFDYDEETYSEERIYLFPFKKPDDETLYRISVQLGITKEEILSMDRDAAKRYWNKYEFFMLYNEFLTASWWYAKYKDEMPSAEERLMRAIFSEKEDIYSDFEKRYNGKDLFNRINEKLKIIDSVVPGTIHKDAHIINSEFGTENLFSFSQCNAMIRSFIEMVERLKELFFKALYEEIVVSEINELNFLASWLNASDIYTNTIVTYDNIKAYSEVYKEENSSDFFDYVKILNFIGSSPWRCKEFFDDIELVQKFVDIFPKAKSKLREFAFSVSNISCYYVWSDAKPIMFSEAEEQILSELDKSNSLDEVPPENRAKEISHIYIEKTPDEMDGNEQLIRKILEMSAASSKGGLTVPKRKSFDTSKESFECMKKRISAKRKVGKK